MAKKGTKRSGKSKAQIIREYQNQHPDQQPKDVADALAAKGHKGIDAQYVSMIKFQDKKKEGAAPARVTSSAKGGKVTSDDLMLAKAFVKSMGGVARAKSTLDIFAKLAD